MGILDVGREDVVSVTPDASIEEIAQTMFDQSVGSVLVTDNGSLEGIVTDRDLVIELLTGNGVANMFKDAGVVAGLTAEDVMTADPVTVDSEMEFPNVLRQMADAKARRIPVTEDGDIAGIVTLDDCLVRLAGESQQISAKLESLADVIEAESPNS